MDNEEIMKRLKEVGGFFEVSYKTTFVGYRRNKDGREQEVLVDIFDHGAGTGDSRYFCVATSEDGEVVTGNPSSNLELTLSTVHWYNLDK